METVFIFLSLSLSIAAAEAGKSTAAASQSKASDRMAELTRLHRFPLDEVLFSGDDI